MNKIIKLIALLLPIILCATQCEDDLPLETTIPPHMSIGVARNDAEVNIGDTIWLSGSVTSRVLNYQLNDSVLYDTARVYLYFFRMRKADTENKKNTTLAAEEFNYVTAIGKVEKEDYSWAAYPEKLMFWDSLHRIITCDLSDDNNRYIFRFGIIPQHSGIFALKSDFNHFIVSNYHHELFEDYRLEDDFPFRGSGRIVDNQSPIDSRIYFFKVN